MAPLRYQSVEASGQNDPETVHQHHIVLARSWLKSMLLSGWMGISACATMAPAMPPKPTGEVAVPIESGGGQEKRIEKSQEKARPKPKAKPKRKSDTEIESEKSWDFPTYEPEDPSDDCMEIDRDKPGSCDIA